MRDNDECSRPLVEEVLEDIWGELDGSRTLDVIAATLAERYATDSEQIRGDVLALVARLHDEGLLDPVGSGPQDGVSRSRTRG